MDAGGLWNALLAIAGWALAFTAFGTAMIYGALKITDAGKVRADAGTNRAGERTVGHRLSGTQFKQTQRTNPFRTGDGG